MATLSATDQPLPLASDARVAQLRGVVLSVQRRLRLREAVSLFPMSAALGLLAAMLLAAADRFRPLVSWPLLLLMSAGLVLGALATSTLYALLRSRDLQATARHADVMLSLDERLSTALEEAGRPVANPTREQFSLLNAQLDDALAAATRVDTGRDLPLRVDMGRWMPTGAALLLLLAVMFAPLPGGGLFGQSNPAQPQISSEQKQIEELKKALQSQPTALDDPARQALLKELDALSRDLSRDGLSKEEALARLSESENKLEKTLDPQSSAERAALDELAKQLAASGNSDLKQAGESLRNGDAKQAADSLKKAGQNAASMTPEERKALADTLRQARDSTASLDPALARSLNDASQALTSQDSKAAQQAMNNLGQTVEQKSQSQATQQQVQQALGQIQSSKQNVAQAGQATPGTLNGTPQAGGTSVAGGTALAGSPIAQGGSPMPSLGSPQPGGSPVSASGTTVALGSPVSGRPAQTGTPVLVKGTPGAGGTPVVAQGPPQQGQQGQGQGQGQQSQSQDQGQQGQGQGQSQSGQQQSGPPAGGWGKGHEEPVYAPPSSVNAPSTAVPLQGRDNPGGEQSSTTTNTDLNNTAPAQVPYSQVYGQYKDQAGNALKSDYIPQGYKDLVRDYFNGIDPEKQRAIRSQKTDISFP